MKNKEYKLQDSAYNKAYKRVKELRGFYSHAIVYVLVNIFILAFTYRFLKSNESIFQLKYFSTLFFWGIGLLAHGLAVFIPNMILSSSWQEKKIRELMEKEQQKK